MTASVMGAYVDQYGYFHAAPNRRRARVLKAPDRQHRIERSEVRWGRIEKCRYREPRTRATHSVVERVPGERVRLGEAQNRNLEESPEEHDPVDVHAPAAHVEWAGGEVDLVVVGEHAAAHHGDDVGEVEGDGALRGGSAGAGDGVSA
jgi:hypothetical protein